MIVSRREDVVGRSLVLAAIRPALRAFPCRAQDSSAARLKEMTELARGLTLAGADGKALELRPEPIVRYDDQPRYIEDATLWALGGKGRPAGVLKVELILGACPLWSRVLADAKITK